MRPGSVTLVDGWWARMVGIDSPLLWRESTVRPHGVLGGYPGWFVAWRGTTVHVSAPGGDWPDELEPRAGTEFWAEFARVRGLRLLGPSRHSYLDREPPLSPDVREVTAIDSLRAAVSGHEWAVSGFGGAGGAVLEQYALVEDGRVVAAANLTEFDGLPRDVGVLVAPAARGRGLAKAVGGHAAARAVRNHGIARWRAVESNRASLAVADHLGFTPWCLQLAVR